MRHNFMYDGEEWDDVAQKNTGTKYKCTFCETVIVHDYDDPEACFPPGDCWKNLLPNNGKINLWLDDERKTPSGWVHCTRVCDAKALLLAGLVENCSLDHDLGFTDDADPLKNVECETGYDLVKWMAEHCIWPSKKPLVHSANPAGAANMRATIDRHFPED